MHFLVGQIEEAAVLVKKYHYSRRPPANVQFVGTLHLDGGLFGDQGECVAACCFSIPPTRWKEKVFELSRLVRKEDVNVNLSFLISKCLKLLKKKIDLVVSFADFTQGHHGGIYQACSWNFSGKRMRQMDGLLINSKFIPGRSCNSMFGTRSPERIKSVLRFADIEPHYDEGKFLYWKALSRNGAKKAGRLGLVALDYPKPYQNTHATDAM
jgi:hypothetical protein